MKLRELILKAESGNCLLCDEAPCANACMQNVAIDKAIRSIVFDNISNAEYLINKNYCADCYDQVCMTSCNRSKFDNPVDIAKIVSLVSENNSSKTKDVDISTDLCGVKCENPFFFRRRLLEVIMKWLQKLLKWVGQE